MKSVVVCLLMVAVICSALDSGTENRSEIRSSMRERKEEAFRFRTSETEVDYEDDHKKMERAKRESAGDHKIDATRPEHADHKPHRFHTNPLIKKAKDLMLQFKPSNTGNGTALRRPVRRGMIRRRTTTPKPQRKITAKLWLG